LRDDSSFDTQEKLMKLQFLQTLRAVVQRGSFAAAAEQVNLTPSAVSLQMKQLEVYFGQPLFDRSGRTVRLTPFARELTATVERATSEIEALRHQPAIAPAGRVPLGITESALTTLLPKAFADLRQRAPGIELHIERGSTPDLLQALRAGRVDAAVLIRPPTGGHSRLLWTDLLAEPLVLVVPAGMPGNHPESLLRQHLWIRLDRRLVAGQLAARFVDALVPHRPALVDVPGIDAIVAMVAAGIGISVLPRLRREHLEEFAVREVSLGRRAPIRQMAMVRRRADGGHRLIDVVESCLVDAAAQLGG
jgi:DNA-binding transcriptional LysR family regulator